LKKACDGGIAVGCFNLGTLYDFAQGVKQDYSKAFEYYKKACDGGEVAGCTILGYSYDNGRGVKQNKSTAKEFYGKACDLQFQESCYMYKELNEQDH
jgi:TPR repeat protein